MVMGRQSPLFSWVMYQQFLLSFTVSYHPFCYFVHLQERLDQTTETVVVSMSNSKI